MSHTTPDPKPGSNRAARARGAANVDTSGQLELIVDQAAGPASGDDHREAKLEIDGLLRPTLVRASAGTGKTYQLTARLLKILLQGASPETILATTFTRKAAGEILDRVLVTLAAAADEEDDEALQKLRDQVGIDSLPRSICLQLLTTLVRNIHRLRICTLDSLFAQLARSFPFELELPPAWRLTDDIEEVRFRERAVDSVIAMLEPTEMTAVLSMLGKGDTKRSVARELLQVVDAAYSIQRQCGHQVWSKLGAPKQPDPDDITKAIESMRAAEPPQKRLREKLLQVAERLEHNELDALVDDRLLANIALARRTKSPVKYYRSTFPDGLDEALDTLYAAVRTSVLGLLRLQNDATGTVLAAYDHHVAALKHTARVLGFDDVAVRLASRFGVVGDNLLDHRVLGDRMDGSIDHVLLDEFQDTSPVQWQVLRPLAARVADFQPDLDVSPHEVEVSRSFFCVGDTKQAIYGWRGGVAEIFDAVADQLPDVEEVEQNTSHRSSPVVIGFVNDLFRNLHRHPLASAAGSDDPSDKAMYEASAACRFARQFPEHKFAKENLRGYVRVETARKVTDGDNEAKRMACFEDAAKRVAEIHRAGAGKSIGVLTRTNLGVAQLIYLLERQGIEVSQEGGNPLTDSAAVEVVLSALMMAEHPGDGRWAFHVSPTPIAEAAGLDGDAIRVMVEQIGLAEAVETLAGILAPSCDRGETARLKQLTHLAMTYQPNTGPRIRDFVRTVREKRVERPQAAPVRVMTVHQAKGLEFDAVVLPELDAPLTRQSGHCVAEMPEIGQPPEAVTRYVNTKSWHFLPKHWQRAFGAQAERNMTEALCLLYVAITRARQAIYLMITPPTKPAFENRCASSLIFHAMECDVDPTEGENTLLERGDPNWCR